MKLFSMFLFALLVGCGGDGGASVSSSTENSPTAPAATSQIQFGNGTFGTAKFSQ